MFYQHGFVGCRWDGLVEIDSVIIVVGNIQRTEMTQRMTIDDDQHD